MHDRPARPTAFCWNQKYPRVCGEKRIKNRDRGQYRGSPPHMRGKAWLSGKLYCSFGITPAYAGKRQLRPIAYTSPWDHPRICGEKARLSRRSSPSQESPPRMRGKDRDLPKLSSDWRITPAYAGKSTVAVGQRVCGRDHPRVCGEKGCSACHAKEKPGSPPHMRGKESVILRRFRHHGITPAYAGKSSGRMR